MGRGRRAARGHELSIGVRELRLTSSLIQPPRPAAASAALHDLVQPHWEYHGRPVAR
jgi:hypothetical protein